MKKLISILAVLLLSVSVTVSAYAQGEPGANADTQSEQDEMNELLQAQEYAQSQQHATDDDVFEQMDQMAAAGATWVIYADGLAGRGTVERPDEYWEQNGYPDNISFSCEVGGELLDNGTNVIFWEIGVVNADEAAKQEILDLVSPNCRVTFRDCTYAYNQRKAAFDEISASLGDIVQFVIMSRNSEHVAVVVASGYEEEYAQKLLEEYGAFILVQNGLPVDNAGLAMDGAIIVDPISKVNVNWFLPAVMIMLCFVATIVFFNRTRLVAAFQTNSGSIVTGNSPVSRKQIIAAIKNSAITPPDDTFDSIMDKIENAQK